MRQTDARVGGADGEAVDRLSLSSGGYLYPRAGTTDRQQASEATEQRSLLVEVDQLVVNPMWLTGGSIAVSSLAGAVSPDYRVFTSSTHVEPRFLHHLLRSQPYRDQYDLFVRANTTFDRRIQQQDLDQMPLWLPPRDAQQRIAEFLDDRVARIDRIIAARADQMKLVNAMFRSEVAGMVSGIGVAWMEGALRRFVTSEDAVRVPLSGEERAQRKGPYPYFGASGAIDSVDDYLFEGPRVLLSEDGANLLARSSPIAFVADGRYWVNNHAHVLQPLDGAHDFWAARIESLDVSPWVTGSAQPKLTVDAAMALRVSTPATVAERLQLGEAVRRVRVVAEGRIEDLKRSMVILDEYKQSLITAAATGDLDVTTAGSGIPG